MGAMRRIYSFLCPVSLYSDNREVLSDPEMKTTRKIDFGGAEAAFAVANTPLFLLRKLRADGAAGNIARSNSGRAILADLARALRRKPVGFAESVLPYLLIVALSYKPDIRFLRAASRKHALHYPWYSYIANVLLQEFRSTSKSNVRVPLATKVTQSTTTSTPLNVIRLRA